MDSFLLLSFIFLAAGVAVVPIATRLGLGSVLGFLIAGIFLGPVLQALGVDVDSIQNVAEFGVVMMLFLVGLEVQPKTLWQMKARLFGLGGLQVGLTALAVMGVAMLFGQTWTVALAIGLIATMSSTAIVLQTLNEKGLIRSDGGRASFSILLFQDIAVIPILTVLPLLAMPELVGLAGNAEPGEGSSGLNLVAGLPAWLAALVTVSAIAAVILGGNYLTRPIFRYVDMAQLRELFTATALVIVIGIALLMTLVGLSPALGAFVAGVVLANSEYRHELESDIDPFKGLLLGLFFITVGASIDFQLLFANIAGVVAMTLALLAIKAGVVYLSCLIFRVSGSDRWLAALGLAQAGEFGFVLLSFAVANNALPPGVADQLLLVVALSMLATPALFILYDRVIAPRYATAQATPPDEIEPDGTIIIAGHGRFGGIVNRMLMSAGYKTVVLDHSSKQLDMLRTFGFKVFFGDATRPDLLAAAGIAQARMLIVAIDDRDQATELVRYVTANYAHVYIVARARSRDHVYELYAAGCRDIIRETFDGGVRAGRSAMEALGMHPFEAQRRSKDFEDRDRTALAALAEVYDPDIPIQQNAAYIARAREMREQQEAEMKAGPGGYASRVDRGWSPPTLSDVVAEAEADAVERAEET
ncbi:MAG: monovalent cation:proton antiporter-2 (CPA2) family protein [Pseudomonadota bacterium]